MKNKKKIKFKLNYNPWCQHDFEDFKVKIYHFLRLKNLIDFDFV